ncbi:hypothetical protein N0V83_010024 [Neocucurbitaria cava]|uniref:Uncharacterized protein n=1 Tax=Neocucurbitaria cava TaxID=798079 RepID=A0A9W9CHP6_9PLEO|nr:hypothetical protein N0V83_010024 [Neocucurbitaria cava]
MEKDPVTKGRLEVLYDTRSEVPGTNIVLLGCTLWSKIPDADVAAVLKKMPEFDEKDGIQDWSIEKHNAEHKRDYKWLLDEINNSQSTTLRPPAGASALPAQASGSATPKSETQLVVVSCFAPELRESLDPWQVDAPWASAYGTNLLDNPPHFSNVKTWISGMTGRTHEFKKGNTTLVSNQRGREGEHVTGLLKDGMSEKQKAGLFDVMRVSKL